MHIRSFIHLSIVSIISLGWHTQAFTPTLKGIATYSTPLPTTTRSTSKCKTSISAVTTADAASVFGRLADRAYVPPPSDVQGTAASGYEFGVMEAGRPKWLCTYEERSGKTQGGGKEMIHVPNWISYLFGGEDRVLKGKEKLRELLVDGAVVQFAMPLSAPPGTKAVATELPSNEAIDALWSLLGGDDEGYSSLNVKDVSVRLRETANKYGSSTEDHYTFQVFEKAFLASGEGA